ncbi:arylsulfatase A-like enzyme [Flavobacterium granuli]|uniref:Arylsulfatase A n=2 Tax=Flavobacterium granuli TaxID=280093 RepID=A0A1M5IY78_9FLAO|nr:arylsulfatase A-like enzyme [Flavobacterium granuli]SHG32703.1 Arylsulfatase A [Flavobacterium granuli]
MMNVSLNKFRFCVSMMLLILFMGSAKAQFSKKDKKSRPNIIVFLVDDMGWMDTSVPFGDSVMPLNKRYHTPNMERLSKEGMKFTNAYAQPVCTPTRASMLSGMNAAHARITNWTSPANNNPTDNADEQFSAPEWNYNGMSPVAGIPHTQYATPFPQLLKDAGYFTVHVGKAHWGSAGTPGANPLSMGFITNIAGHAAGHPQSYLGEDNYGNKAGKASWQAVPDLGEYYGTGTFLTDALTKEAIKTLENPIKNKQPFYLNMAHYAVHDPIMADPRYYQKYIDAGLDQVEAKYASLVEGMDQSLGDVMDYLKSKQADKNTIIVFMSDNGGLSLAPPRGGQAHTQNLPLKAGKGSVNEGGIRVPMIVKWPGVTKPASVADQYVIIEDFFPSLLEMAKVSDDKKVQDIDGKSFVPILKNPDFKDDNRALIWHIPNKWIANEGPGINYQSAIRKGDWKLIYDMRDQSKQLYNLKTDIGEHIDLVDKHPEVVKTLSKTLSEQLRQWKATMPIDKKTNQPVQMPDESE